MGEFGPFGPRRCGRTTKQLEQVIKIASGDEYRDWPPRRVAFICSTWNAAAQIRERLRSMCSDEVMNYIEVWAAGDIYEWRECRRGRDGWEIYTDHAAWEIYMERPSLAASSCLTLYEQGLLMRDYTICAFTAPPEAAKD